MKKVSKPRHGPRHVTPAGRSVFYDLFPKVEAEELEIRSALLLALERWLAKSNLTQVEAAKMFRDHASPSLRYQARQD
jgi:hypothetical protein